MYRYITVFLLIHTCNFVSPLPTNVNNGSVAGWLAALAERCVEPFIKTQIINHTNDCNVPSSPFRENQFECMLFYDINTRLCDAIATKKAILSQESVAKINEKGTLNKFCTEAKDLVVSNLTDYPLYKDYADKIFASTIKCAQYCGVVDVTNEDANFYCKYFKWGSEVLAPLPETASASSAPDSSGAYKTKIEALPAIHPSQKTSLNTNAVLGGSSSNTNVLLNGEESNASGKSRTITSPKSLSADNHRQLSTGNPGLVSTTAPTPGQEHSTKSIKKDTVQSSVSNAFQGTDSLNNLGIPPASSINAEDKLFARNGQSHHQITGVKNNKPKTNDADADYPDEGGFDGDLQGGEDNDDPDIKLLPNQPVNLPNNRGPILNTIDDSFAEQDDDHFFPFFLTTIILVVLLYVLYHNKNKVTKVLLGLIVEGRQTNRRRNSRGPAYRRLDTLEQAMSTNSSAPPSKIIY